MTIEPDTKNWTWVLERVCPDCGFDAAAVDRSQMAALARANATQWPILLDADDVRLRPHNGQWSALEYGCHVRDVFRLFDERLRIMLNTVDPALENWDQDETAVEQRYDLQDPAVVADELVAAGEAMARTLELIGEGDWDRRGYRSDGAEFTVDSFVRYFLHDPAHHLVDVANGNAQLRA